MLHFRGSPQLCLDLREPVSAAQREALAELGLERSFGVVTAEDPMGRTQPRALNEKLQAQLQHDVVELGVPFVVLDACSPDRSHCEQSIAVAMDRERVVDMACRYRQLAIFWFDGASFWIVPAVSEEREARLP